MPTPVLGSGSTPITAVRSQVKRLTTAWFRLVPARTQLRIFSTGSLGFAIGLTARAANDPMEENLRKAFFAWIIWATVALSPPFERARQSNTRSVVRSVVRSLRVTWVRSIRWLGFVMPRPTSQMVGWKKIALWVVLVPVLVAVGHYLLFESVVNLETWFPITDVDVIAARNEREDYLLRGGFFTAMTGAFLLAAVPEEILFRSGVLAVQRWKPSNRILILSVASVMLVLFAGWHASFGFSNVVFSFVGGAFFTALALYTRSLWPAIVAHGVGNLISAAHLILTS